MEQRQHPALLAQRYLDSGKRETRVRWRFEATATAAPTAAPTAPTAAGPSARSGPCACHGAGCAAAPACATSTSPRYGEREGHVRS